ncbi:hypothetical protein PR048_020203 [Dryococelus australis]|uniref:Uncharacterized protein n=1 Tax=Dryococelus australis TaxID=614101 RepID=A0ABQ9H5S0_9NEOP|nr:hypothetical protein PR048_020203 [Dryococelus australis]
MVALAFIADVATPMHCLVDPLEVARRCLNRVASRLYLFENAVVLHRQRTKGCGRTPTRHQLLNSQHGPQSHRLKAKQPKVTSPKWLRLLPPIITADRHNQRNVDTHKVPVLSPIITADRQHQRNVDTQKVPVLPPIITADRQHQRNVDTPKLASLRRLDVATISGLRQLVVITYRVLTGLMSQWCRCRDAGPYDVSRGGTVAEELALAAQDSEEDPETTPGPFSGCHTPPWAGPPWLFGRPRDARERASPTPGGRRLAGRRGAAIGQDRAARRRSPPSSPPPLQKVTPRHAGRRRLSPAHNVVSSCRRRLSQPRRRALGGWGNSAKSSPRPSCRRQRTTETSRVALRTIVAGKASAVTVKDCLLLCSGMSVAKWWVFVCTAALLANVVLASATTEYSLPTKANRVQFPTESLMDILTWESCRTIPLLGFLVAVKLLVGAVAFKLLVGAVVVKLLVGAVAVKLLVGAVTVKLLVGAVVVKLLVGAVTVKLLVGVVAVKLLVGAVAVKLQVGAVAVKLLVRAVAVKLLVGAVAVKLLVGAVAVKLLVGVVAVKLLVGAVAVKLLVGAVAVKLLRLIVPHCRTGGEGEDLWMNDERQLRTILLQSVACDELLQGKLAVTKNFLLIARCTERPNYQNIRAHPTRVCIFSVTGGGGGPVTIDSLTRIFSRFLSTSSAGEGGAVTQASLADVSYSRDFPKWSEQAVSASSREEGRFERLNAGVEGNWGTTRRTIQPTATSTMFLPCKNPSMTALELELCAPYASVLSLRAVYRILAPIPRSRDANVIPQTAVFLRAHSLPLSDHFPFAVLRIKSGARITHYSRAAIIAALVPSPLTKPLAGTGPGHCIGRNRWRIGESKSRWTRGTFGGRLRSPGESRGQTAPLIGGSVLPTHGTCNQVSYNNRYFTLPPDHNSSLQGKETLTDMNSVRGHSTYSKNTQTELRSTRPVKLVNLFKQDRDENILSNNSIWRRRRTIDTSKNKIVKKVQKGREWNGDFPSKKHECTNDKRSSYGNTVCHPSGWIQTHLFTAWFKHFVVTIDLTKYSPLLLILDGYYSDTRNIDAIYIEWENNRNGPWKRKRKRKCRRMKDCYRNRRNKWRSTNKLERVKLKKMILTTNLWILQYWVLQRWSFLDRVVILLRKMLNTCFSVSFGTSDTSGEQWVKCIMCSDCTYVECSVINREFRCTRSSTHSTGSPSDNSAHSVVRSLHFEDLFMLSRLALAFPENYNTYRYGRILDKENSLLNIPTTRLRCLSEHRSCPESDGPCTKLPFYYSCGVEGDSWYPETFGVALRGQATHPPPAPHIMVNANEDKQREQGWSADRRIA